MSDLYISYIGSQTPRTSPDVGPFDPSEKVAERFFPRAKVRWSIQIQDALLSFFNKLDYPFRNYLAIPFEEPLRSEVRRFFISLDAYIESPNPVIPYRSILMGAASKDFATYLKRVKRKSFLTTRNCELFEFPDWWSDVPSYLISDIGDIFNFSYLIFFEEEVDDYKNGFIPVKIVDGAIAKFKLYLSDLLPGRDKFQKVDEYEVLSHISSSSSFDSASRKTRPHYLIKPSKLTFSSKRKLGKRSIIHVGPENTRDSVILDPEDLNTISLIDLQVMEILRVMPGHIHLRDRERINKRLKSLMMKCSFFLQRDLKKEGITKPRALLTAMLEVLHDHYPDIEIFRYTDFYDEYSLLIEDEIVHPLRGHGLGMANALTTLMQLAIDHWIVDELVDDTPDIHSKILCLNDDFVVGFDNEDHLELYWDKEDEVMEQLSILREPTKSFRSTHFYVLAERYITSLGEYEKVSYQLRELLLPLTCYNITHAKSYFISAQTYVSSKYVDRYLGEIQSYWGYEFFPDEFMYPSIVGGWINEIVSSVNMGLVALDHLPLKSYVFRGFKASKAQIYSRGKGDYYSSPALTLMGDPEIPEEYWANFDKLPYSLITEKYGRSLKLSRRGFKNFWDKVYKVRQKVFKKPVDYTYEDLILRIKDSFRSTQFYPNSSMIKCYHQGNITCANINDIYIDPNPKLALISKFNETNYQFKEEFSIQFTRMDDFRHKEYQLYPKEIQRTLKNEFLNQLFTGKEKEIYYPSDPEIRPEEWYINPVKIGEVTALLNYGIGYPEPHDRFKDALVKEKYSIYNRLFTLKELEMLTKCKLSRPNILTIAKYMNDTGDTLESILEFLSQELQEEILAPDKDESHPPSPEPEMEPPSAVRWFDEDTIYVGQDSLFKEGLPEFFLYRQGNISCMFENETVEDIFNELTTTATYLSFPRLRTPEQKEQIIDDWLKDPRPMYRLAFKNSGLASLTEVHDPFSDDEEGSDPFASLFDGE